MQVHQFCATGAVWHDVGEAVAMLKTLQRTILERGPGRVLDPSTTCTRSVRLFLRSVSWREVRALGRALGGNQPTSMVCCGGRAMAATSQVWSWPVRPARLRTWMLGPQVFSVQRSPGGDLAALARSSPPCCSKWRAVAACILLGT